MLFEKGFVRYLFSTVCFQKGDVHAHNLRYLAEIQDSREPSCLALQAS